MDFISVMTHKLLSGELPSAVEAVCRIDREERGGVVFLGSHRVSLLIIESFLL